MTTRPLRSAWNISLKQIGKSSITVSIWGVLVTRFNFWAEQWFILIVITFKSWISFKLSWPMDCQKGSKPGESHSLTKNSSHCHPKASVLLLFQFFKQISRRLKYHCCQIYSICFFHCPFSLSHRNHCWNLNSIHQNQNCSKYF